MLSFSELKPCISPRTGLPLTALLQPSWAGVLAMLGGLPGPGPRWVCLETPWRGAYKAVIVE